MRHISGLLVRRTFESGIKLSVRNSRCLTVVEIERQTSLFQIGKTNLLTSPTISKRYKSEAIRDDEWSGDPSLDKDSKVVKINIPSTRLDLVLKGALGTARNKIEKTFYESKIRLNGKKVMKKSIQVHEGDEIDVIKSVSPKNPDHIIISRVEIMKMAPNEENIALTARRFKTLLIENYEKDPYKGSSSDG